MTVRHIARIVRYALAALVVASVAPAGAATIKVMTYNTHHGGLSTTPTTTDAQLDTIAAQNPDVVVLQEPYRNQLTYYVNGLNSRMGTSAWHGTYGDNCSQGTAPTCTTWQGEGVMLLTRLATASVNERLIWAADDYVVARATIQMEVVTSNGTAVNIFVCHLPALSDAETSRETYVNTLKSWASTFAGPQLVGGDFNAHPGTTEINMLEQMFTDAWVTGGSGYGYTHPADIPTSRIDYWFSKTNGGETLSSVAVIPDSTDSDHRPVVATYNITSSAPTSTSETTLFDDAFSTLDRTRWPGGVFTGSTDTTIPLAASGQFQIGALKASTTGSHYNGVSTGTYNLTSNGSAYVRLAVPANISTYAYTMFAMGSDGSDYYRWYASANALVAEKRISGTKTTLVNLPYDATADQFIRIRNYYNSQGGVYQVIFETAPNNNGVPGTWTARHTETWDSHVNISAMKFELKAGTSTAVLSPGSAYWDTFHAALNTTK